MNEAKGNYGKGKGKDSYQGKGYKGGQKGGFKGDGKGKGKGGGKTGSATEFQGYCSYCGLWGHTQRYCERRDQDWNTGKGANNLENYAENAETEEKKGEEEGYGDLGGLGLHNVMKDEPGASRTWVPKCNARLPRSSSSSFTHHCCNPPGIELKNRFHKLQPVEEEDENDYAELFHFQGDTEGNRVKLEVVADSGAADCVLPTHLLPEIPLQPGKSVNYKAASGKILSSRGAKTILGEAGGCKKKLEFQVADIHKPLASLRKIVRKGHRVVLDDGEPGGGYIMNKATGDKVELRVQNEVYVFDFWVDLAASTATSATSSMSGF